MSGTSLDGIDLVLCRFTENKGKWNFQILSCETVMYTGKWLDLLSKAYELSPEELNTLDIEFGKYIGQLALKFLEGSSLEVQLISSHGHTIFHEPDKGITFQLGCGEEINRITGKITVSDFRKTDVELGGQGAPLVPVGDELLFNEYDYCLNLGGFANISFTKKGNRYAFDICPVNTVLNPLAQISGYPFDPEGNIGRSGQLNTPLLNRLNQISYYKKTYPKSLGKEWLLREFQPVLNEYKLSVKDKLKTLYEHIAQQIGSVIETNKSVFVTGGGTYNAYLLERIEEFCQGKFLIPGNEFIEYKEALVFGLLGLLRLRNEINCFATVTGAKKDSICGTIYSG